MIELEVAFGKAGNSDRFIAEGWGAVVPFGRWMIDEVSVLVLPPPPRRCGHLDVAGVIGPFWPPGRYPNQAFSVHLNDVELFSEKLDNMCEVRFRIPGEMIDPDRPLVLEFRHADPVASEDEGGQLQRLAASIWTLTLIGHDDDIPSESPASPRTPPIFHVRSKGNVGNRMIQYMAALAVQKAVPGCILSGIELDEWGLSSGSVGPDWADHVITYQQHIDFFSTVQYLRTHPGGKVVYRGYGQRFENLLDVQTYRDVFVPTVLDVPTFDSRYLVINVRSGDVVAGRFADYVLIPVQFYSSLIWQTGLKPVFMGQLESNAYTDLLRRSFPDALFLDSLGHMWDFELIRRARNIVTSVSTFSWVAAWLSRADRIYMPVNGLFNPEQCPSVDLLPLGDPRFEFHLFPVNHAAEPEHFEEVHERMADRWCRVSHAMLSEIRMRATRMA